MANAHDAHGAHDIDQEKASEHHISLKLEGLYCTGCADAIEQALRTQPQITSVHLDWATDTAHVWYRSGMITPAAIERLISKTGCSCIPAEAGAGMPGGPSHSDYANAEKKAGTVQPSSSVQMQHLRHAVDILPITMGTKHDRMQYEMPRLAAHKHHHAMDSAQSQVGAPNKDTVTLSGRQVGQVASAAQPGHEDHEASSAAKQAPVSMHSTPGNHEHNISHSSGSPAGTMDHASMGHTGGGGQAGQGGQGGMDHDMSDPGMAAAMETQIRNKFFIALLLTIPTILYSPMGNNLLGLTLPDFGLGTNWIMLVLTTPVVFYCGWMFISGAYSSLRHRMLNMSVLIATGVLAAYLASVLLTFFGSETFFEAAAMLVTFVLFGHWMEMRARKGTNEAMRALFDLVPPQATIIRDGTEVTISSSEVAVGDVVLLRPGDKVAVDGEVIDGETS
ncbi:MAG: heavy metal translocating P-type ATPase, partial [Chloroflexota bacterium]